MTIYGEERRCPRAVDSAERVQEKLVVTEVEEHYLESVVGLVAECYGAAVGGRSSQA